MKRRCLSPTKKEKRLYRGIKICEEWKDFGNFLVWAMENGYTDKLTIDRIDGSKGYCPENCRFVDYATQGANKKITAANKTGLIGVYSRAGRWQAKLHWRRKQIHIGCFDTKEDAAIARDKYILDNNLPHTRNYKRIKQIFSKRARLLKKRRENYG